MTTEEDPYVMLGITSKASRSEVKKAYRKLALKSHPDKQKSGATAEELERIAVRFTKIASAYEILHDEEERLQYDLRKMHGGEPGTRYETKSSVDDEDDDNDYEEEEPKPEKTTDSPKKKKSSKLKSPKSKKSSTKKSVVSGKGNKNAKVPTDPHKTFEKVFGKDVQKEALSASERELNASFSSPVRSPKKKVPSSKKYPKSPKSKKSSSATLSSILLEPDEMDSEQEPSLPAVVEKEAVESVNDDDSVDPYVPVLVPRVVDRTAVEELIETASFETDLLQTLTDSLVASSSRHVAFCAATSVADMDSRNASTAEAPVSDSKSPVSQMSIQAGYYSAGLPDNKNDFYVTKVSGGHGRSSRSIPKKASHLQIYQTSTCQLQGIVQDEGRLTEHGTAALGALAIRHLSSSSIQKIGILGTGLQARRQLHYLAHVTDCRHVIVCGRTPARVERLARELKSDGWTVQATLDSVVLLDECDVLVTATSSCEAILGGANRNAEDDEDTALRRAMEIRRKRVDPQLIVCVGANEPGKVEIHPALVASADRLVADSVVQATERGEFRGAIGQGLVSAKRVLEFGELLACQDAAEILPCEGLTIFDASGIAAQDYAVAKMVLQLWQQQ